jgi:PAS domain-containing protein
MTWGLQRSKPPGDLRDHDVRPNPRAGRHVLPVRVREPVDQPLPTDRRRAPVPDLGHDRPGHVPRACRLSAVLPSVRDRVPGRGRASLKRTVDRWYRERQDFNSHEVGLLALARPYLMHAYRNAELWSEREAMLAALREGLDTVGRHVVVLDPHGRVEFASDGARQLLGPQITTLPSEVSRWLVSHPAPRAAAPPLRLGDRYGETLIRVLPSSRDDRRQVLLLEAGTGELSVPALRALGLTDRQASRYTCSRSDIHRWRPQLSWASPDAPSTSISNTHTPSSASTPSPKRPIVRGPPSGFNHPPTELPLGRLRRVCSTASRATPSRKGTARGVSAIALATRPFRSSARPEWTLA